MGRGIRILHVLGSLQLGGVETWLLHLLRRLDRQRFQFDFCLLSGERGEYASEMEALGSRLIPCRLGQNPLSFARRFRRVLREGRYDIVHSHVLYFSGAILRWAFAEGVRVRIAHSHTAYDGKAAAFGRSLYKRVMKRWLERYATQGVAASEAAAVQLYGPHWQTNARLRILLYGIDLEPFRTPLDPAAVRGEFGIPVHSPVVGHVGRFAPMKNHRFLLQVAAEIVRRRPEIHFLLVGDGPLRAETEAQARSLGLQSQMHFAGIRRDVPRLLRGAMDLFLFPSLYEGLGLVLLEAQAAGLRAVVSDAVPREAVVFPPGICYLSLSAGAAEWAAEVVRLVDEPRLEASAALKCVSESPFAIERSVQSLSHLYETSG